MKKAIFLCVLVGVLCAFAVAEGNQNRQMSKASAVSQQGETKLLKTQRSVWKNMKTKLLKTHVNVLRKWNKALKKFANNTRLGRWVAKTKFGKWLMRKVHGVEKAFFELLIRHQGGAVPNTKYLRYGKNFYAKESPINCAVQVDQYGDLVAETICAAKVEAFATKREATGFLETGTRAQVGLPTFVKGPAKGCITKSIFAEGGLPRQRKDADVFEINEAFAKCGISVFNSDVDVEFKNDIGEHLHVFKDGDGLSYKVWGEKSRRRLLQPGGESGGC